jgi:hypothetical protein
MFVAQPFCIDLMVPSSIGSFSYALIVNLGTLRVLSLGGFKAL